VAIDGGLLKQARESRGRSQSMIADVISADQTYISKIEKNKLLGGIKGDELLRIAGFLQYDPYVFIGKLSFEEGDLKTKANQPKLNEIAEMVSRLDEKISPPEDIDELANRVTLKPELRKIVAMIAYEDSTLLRRIFDRLAGWLEMFKETEEDRKKRAG